MTLTARPPADPKFYEARHAAHGDRYLPRYIPLYEAAAALIPQDAKVVELGCGAGRFAPYALDRTEDYLGVDFAPALVEQARASNPTGLFEVRDLRTDALPRGEVYVLLEVLEHLDDDLALLRRIQWGRLVILSVPSFDSAAHVRKFPEEGSASARYGDLLRIEHEQVIPLPSGAFFHLIAGRARAPRRSAP